MFSTIKSSDEISCVFKQGRRLNTPYVTLLVLSTKIQHGPRGRVAFIAGKKLGNAVWRNKAKRRMRAVYTVIGPMPGYDVIFLARSRTTEASFSTMVESCKKSLLKEGILPN